MSQYISNKYGFYLPPFGNNEGQMMPSVKDIMRKAPWDKNHEIPWQDIKTKWDDALLQSNKEIFFEASPPNLLRISAIKLAFGQCKCVVSISNPYSMIGSMRFRYNNTNFVNMANHWLRCAYELKKSISKYGFNLISYEKFCDDPQVLDKAFGLDINNNNKHYFSGKADPRGIINFNDRNIAVLTQQELDKINSILLMEENNFILQYFDYVPILNINQYLSNADKAMVSEGLKRQFKIQEN